MDTGTQNAGSGNFAGNLFLVFLLGAGIGLLGMFTYAIAMLADALRREKDDKKRRSNRTAFFVSLGIFVISAAVVLVIRYIAYGRIR